MNWYKKGQNNNITLDNIIWAIDEIIIKDNILTVEDYLEAEQRLGYSQQEILKAAQVKNKQRKGRQQTSNTQQLPSTRIKYLLDRGYSNKEISKKLKMPIEQVENVVYSLFPTVKQKKEHLRNLNDKNIKNTIEDLNTNSFEKITIPRISDELGGISVSYIKKFIINNDINLKKLANEREKRIAEMVVTLVKNMKTVKNAEEIRLRFKKEHNHLLPKTNLSRILKYNNIITEQTHMKQNYMFTAFRLFLSQHGIDGAEILTVAPERLSKIIDNFTLEYGPEYGFIEPMDKIKLKQFLMAKIQLRDRSLAQGKNRLLFKDVNMPNKIKPYVINLIDQGVSIEDILRDRALKQYDKNIIKQFYHTYQLQRGPMIADESHPSYFIGNEESI